MGDTRRTVVLGAAAAAALVRAPHIAQAQSRPLKIGCLAGLTGQLSAPGIAAEASARFGVNAINAAGGINGRQIEMITRDTQAEPAKAVNAVQDMISNAKVNAVIGPISSGEALATTPIMARAKMMNLHGCFVDKLIDPKLYPNAFRMAPMNSMVINLAANYVFDKLGAKQVAVIGDPTGYGQSTVQEFNPAYKAKGGNVVYQGTIDSNQPDVVPDLMRMRNAGAEAILVWSVSPALGARVLNARATLNWDVPVVGHNSLGTGETGKLLETRKNWEKVYVQTFRSCSFDASGRLPAKTEEFLQRTRGKLDVGDWMLYWIIYGIDMVDMIALAVKTTGSVESQDIIAFFKTLKHYSGYFTDYSYSETNHNGFPASSLCMGEANSLRDGGYRLAPGYT
ncbi:ABC transporter substrate-binding protein [Enterovirga sp. CN4-39]|uniref:ABC transporter substrate-binding protein n=1 Tax=Enterovirga sp. CN4-39 TaxID=3400910 RepID=UPI003C0057E4